MEQQQQATPAQARATARRVPGLEGTTGRLRVDVEGRPGPRFFAIHDGVIEPAKEADGDVDAAIYFDAESCVEELLAGRLNPIVAALQGRMRATGDLKLLARVIFELQAQATHFGRQMAGEA
jgi:hypothetical protein